MKKLILILVALVGAKAQAISVDWFGTYRFEYVDLSSTSLADPVNKKAYALNSLILSPKIIAVDGINIVSNFEVLSNNLYPGSQTGQPWGLGVNTTTTKNSNVLAKSQGGSSIEVRQLYLTANQEYGSLIVGRAPLEFGLGITYNAGNGPFDHWGDSHDMIGYKFLIGNLSLMPMIGKPYDQDVAQGADITDTMVMIDYNNPETESEFGLLYSERHAGIDVNDSKATLSPTATLSGGWSSRAYNLVIARGFESMKFKFEAGFNDGDTGLVPTAGATDPIKLNGYGLALELDFPRPQSKWEWKVRTGLASGDNPTTSNFEGYAFHRNYDVAFLMFNHPLGQYDLFTSGFQRQRDATGTIYPNERALDEETISNAAYFSPSVKYQFGDHWSWGNSFTYAQLQTNPSATLGDVKKDIGFEWDTSLLYKPHERVQWLNEIGFFLPGGAFRGGNANYDAKFMFGFQTKASISF